MIICRIIIEEFGPNIQHISVVDNIVAYTLIILPSTTIDKYKPCTSKSQCRANELFVIGRVEKTNILPAKTINCIKIKTKITDNYKFQTQYI